MLITVLGLCTAEISGSQNANKDELSTCTLLYSIDLKISSPTSGLTAPGITQDVRPPAQSSSPFLLSSFSSSAESSSLFSSSLSLSSLSSSLRFLFFLWNLNLLDWCIG